MFYRKNEGSSKYFRAGGKRLASARKGEATEALRTGCSDVQPRPSEPYRCDALIYCLNRSWYQGHTRC